jgi:hypothetical protein
MMLQQATTPIALADYLDSYLRKHGALHPGHALADATAEQLQMIIEALRRPPVSRSTAQG